MIARVHSFVLHGIEAGSCEIEADLNMAALPATTIVGLPDAAVKESIERVRSAMHNSGYRFPHGRLTINLAPADVRKEGPVYDLPIAVSLLLADGTIERAAGDRPSSEDCLVAGELSLDGRVRPIKGAISFALHARDTNVPRLIVPADNAAEAAAVDGVEVLGVKTLGEVVGYFNGTHQIEPTPTVDAERLLAEAPPDVDFADVRGQEAAKRALTIAAAGGHNVLMLGPAGTGKTMMARALAGVLPPLNRREALEVTRIYSSVGQIESGRSLITKRPVRSPHHTASSPAIVGGGTIPRPGDVSLAHRGILFLDELPEFTRQVLETLRQPLEDGCVTIARSQGSVKFPARFMMVAAMNPTPKGHMPDDEVSQRAMDKYLSRLSGPLVDRIDIHIEVPAVPFRQLSSPPQGTDSETIRRRVVETRQRQTHRQGDGTVNAELSGKQLDRLARFDDAAKRLLGQAMGEMGLSARAYDKIRRVALTIADLDGSETIESHHVTEAVQYRLLDRMQSATG